jgi:lantibiotic leader peptide-processing serine protease
VECSGDEEEDAMRKLLIGALAAMVGLTLALPFTAGAQSQSPANSAATQQRTAATDYVVLYRTLASATAAKATIKAAGGQVIRENTKLGLATVRSSNANFITAVAGKAGVAGAARNRVIGQAPGREAPKRSEIETEGTKGQGAAAKGTADARDRPRHEPLADKQWGMRMINATPSGSYRIHQGRRSVMVGIMDTGIDGSHPDLRANFNRRLSRNFTTDIPLVDGPCADEPDQSCSDPADVDENGHGTHVAGIVGAPINRLGVAGVAPKVTLVNIRAGQDSGFFFLDATINAFVYAGDVGLDVVNMSFFIDPWLFNCPDDPTATPAEQIEQRTIIAATQLAVGYARNHGVTLVAALGNESIDLTRPTVDVISPDFPPDTERERQVNNSCLVLPVEARGVIGVSALGPSGRLAYYSNHGIEQTDVSAPGGDRRDFFATPQYNTPENRILSTYPRSVLEELELIDENGIPTDPLVLRDCRGSVCGYYRYLQGTSMASPHATGVAALIVSRYGHPDRSGRGWTLSPRRTEWILKVTAEDTPCPSPPALVYPDPDLEGLTNTCEGTLERNGFYGFGVVDAMSAVIRL